MDVLAETRAHVGPWELTIVLPTFNEARNVEVVLQRLSAALDGLAWEAVFVDDDSKDGTATAVMSAARLYPNVRIIRRLGRRGLSSAVVEGALSSMAPFIAVMDADMQHDEAILKDMLEELLSGNYDLVVGTRYSEGGGVGEWSAERRRISQIATRLAQIVTRTKLSDPMSGFFMITREAFEQSMRRLSGQGFKILLDIVASSKQPLRISEKPYRFRQRQFGESKLDTHVAIEYLVLLLDKTIGRLVPVRFLIFAAVGGLGLLVHLAVLAIAFRMLHFDFLTSQAAATILAMTFNFFGNNILTYRDMRLRGFWQLLWGLLSFYAVCSIGALANVGVASFMFTNRYSWWFAGVAGTLVGAVWNYAAASFYTWRSQ